MVDTPFGAGFRLGQAHMPSLEQVPTRYLHWPGLEGARVSVFLSGKANRLVGVRCWRSLRPILSLCRIISLSAFGAYYRTTSEFSIDAGLVTAPIGVGLPT